MNCYLRIIALIFISILVGCSSQINKKCGCTDGQCPFDPCLDICRDVKDCGPTVDQLTEIRKQDCGMCPGIGCTVQELRKKGIQFIEIGDNVIIILPTDHFFEIDCPTIREEAYPTLNCLACILKGYTCVPLSITVHTDDVAPSCYNCWLSDKQVQNIQAYLWVHGIHFKRMRVTGCGDFKPIANHYTVAGNAANRRIEIRIRNVG